MGWIKLQLPLILFYLLYGNITRGSGQIVQDFCVLQVICGPVLLVDFQFFLGLHWYHGGWSILHTLGVATAWGDRVYWTVGGLIALFVTLGHISVPVAVLAGLVK